MIKDYTYVGTEFRGDTNLDLLEGEQWGDLGKKDTMMHVFIFLRFYNFYA